MSYLKPAIRLVRSALMRSRLRRPNTSSLRNILPTALSPSANLVCRSFTTSIRRRDDFPPGRTPYINTDTELSEGQYHKLADSYIETLLAELEELQEDREDIDVEYSAGVLNLEFPPHGAYVLNKQPPNKQIWLSSPVSGPKRYDWVKRETITEADQEATQKTGGSSDVAPGMGGMDGGEWVYLRDGTSLNALLRKELGIQLRRLA